MGDDIDMRNDDTFGSGSPDNGTWAADCCGKSCCNMDSEWHSVSNERTEVNFTRVDLVTVEGIDLNVSTLIELRRGDSNITLTFDIIHKWCGQTFQFDIRASFFEDEWSFFLSTNDVLKGFLTDNRSFVKADEFLTAFRNSLTPVFDFAMTKLPLCGNMALWEMLGGIGSE